MVKQIEANSRPLYANQAPVRGANSVLISTSYTTDIIVGDTHTAGQIPAAVDRSGVVAYGSHVSHLIELEHVVVPSKEYRDLRHETC